MEVVKGQRSDAITSFHTMRKRMVENANFEVAQKAFWVFGLIAVMH